MSKQKAVKQLLDLATEKRDYALQTLIDAKDPAELIEDLGQAAMFAQDGAHFATLAAFIGEDNKDGIFAVWNELDTDPRELIDEFAPDAYKIVSLYAAQDNG